MAKNPNPGLYHLGVVAKAQGTRGGLLIEFLDPEIKTDQWDVLYIRYPEKQWVPYRIDEIRAHHDRKRNLFFVKLKGIHSRTEAEKLMDHDVMTDQSFIFSETETSVIGYQVVRNDFSVIGEVSDLLETPASPVLVVQAGDKQVLIPWVDQFVTECCHSSRRIITCNTSELESLE